MTTNDLHDDSASDIQEVSPSSQQADAENAQGESTPPSPNPNDLDSLWAPMPLIQTQTQVLAMRAGPRPPKDKFFRVLPFELGGVGNANGYKDCRPVYLFEYQFDGDMTPKTFYVRPGTEVAKVLAEKDRLRDAILVLGVVRHGSHFVWELKLPNGRNDIQCPSGVFAFDGNVGTESIVLNRSSQRSTPQLDQRMSQA